MTGGIIAGKHVIHKPSGRVCKVLSTGNGPDGFHCRIEDSEGFRRGVPVDDLRYADELEPIGVERSESDPTFG